jgi:ABC-2 type transport system ATP-binding protein
MPVAEIHNLTVRYGSRTAIPDLTLSIPEGCVGLLGPNGAGKTTLIKTLLGFVQPASGTATVLGLDAAREPLRVRQRIGLMPEVDCHIPGMNGVAFVAYAGELCGMPSAQALRRAHETLEYCGLGEARYRPVETYSTGMKQRIKLAQALVHGPKLLFLDEPTNGLDPQGRDEMLELVRDISRNKAINVIVSSHLLPDIERTCDGLILMRQGKIAQQGSMAELKAMQVAQFDIELRHANDAFVGTLAHRGLTVQNVLGSRYRVTHDGTDPNIGGLIFAAAKDAGAQVRGFAPALRSLEDVFIEAVE